jgi:hypothetical protein
VEALQAIVSLKDGKDLRQMRSHKGKRSRQRQELGNNLSRRVDGVVRIGSTKWLVDQANRLRRADDNTREIAEASDFRDVVAFASCQTVVDADAGNNA